MKLFNRWEMEGIAVADQGIKPYVNLRPVLVPRTCGRNNRVSFHRSKTPIVERLMTKLMVSGHRAKKHLRSSGHNCGKGALVFKITEKALEIIEKKTGKNPVAVLVQAVENAAPREEITTIEYGGARYARAVEVSPQRRVDLALRYMIQGAYSKSFNSKVKIEDALAAEIINAYELSNSSNAISKKVDLERQADSSR